MAGREDTLTITVTLRVPVGAMSMRLKSGVVRRLARRLCWRPGRCRKRFSARPRIGWSGAGGSAGALPRGSVLCHWRCSRCEIVRWKHSLPGLFLELAPRQRMTRFVERQGVSLRVRGLSYRQSAAVLDEMGIAVSAMGLWRRVQARGAQRCRIECGEGTGFWNCGKQAGGAACAPLSGGGRNPCGGAAQRRGQPSN